ncbi:MAG: GTP-binding protein [Acidobacteriia bacterium]|nr:GTP-binding protein [Terriglobia bacterium]
MIRSLAWSPDSCRIASIGYDEALQVRDLASGKIVLEIRGAGRGCSVSWSPDGALLAAAFGEGGIQVHRASTGELIRTLSEHTRYVWDLAWSADSALLASGSLDNQIKIWDVDGGTAIRTLRGHSDSVRGIAWSPDGREVVSISDDRSIRIWDTKAGRSRVIAANSDWLSSVRWSSSGWVAYSSRKRGLTICNPGVGSDPKVLKGECGWVRGLAWSPNGEFVAARGPTNRLTIWSREKAQVHRSFESCDGLGTHAQWSHDGRKLAWASRDEIEITEIHNGRIRATTLLVKRFFGGVVSWARRGTKLASGGNDRIVRIWNVKDASKAFELVGHSSPVLSISWSPDQRSVVSGSYDGKIMVWDIETGTPAGLLQGHTASVGVLAWGPKGRLIASGSEDRTVRIWDVEKRETQTIFEGHTAPVQALAWSKNGEFLVSGGENGELRLWRVRNGALLASLQATPFRQLPRSLYFDKPPETLKALKRLGVFRRAWTPVPSSVQQAPLALSSAKVVLVGDSSVGKSCLALRLAEDRFEERGTTHGMQIWSIPLSPIRSSGFSSLEEVQELYLWDLGGQSEYQLIHQLFLHDTTAAIVLFDATRGDASFEAVEDWNRRIEVQAKGRALRKVLVCTKTDLGGVVDSRRVQSLKERCGFAAYCEVSALTGSGIDAVRHHLQAIAASREHSRISRPALYQAIRTTIHRLRTMKAIIFHGDLCRDLQDDGLSFNVEDLETVLKQLALEGAIVDVLLAQGDRVLVLRIDVVSKYAGSLILSARDNPRGVPALEPQRILSAETTFPGLRQEERLDRATERVVVECVVQILLERGLCFEQAGILIFPTLFPNAALPESGQLRLSRPLFYDFDGPIDNIYSGLIAHIALSGAWGKVSIWNSLAQFDVPGCGAVAISKHERGHFKGHLDIYVSPDVESDRRSVFVLFVEEYLRQREIELLQGLAFECECSYAFSEDLLRNRLAANKDAVICPQCDKLHPLFRPEKSKAITGKVRALRTETERRTDKVVESVKRTMATGVSQPCGPIRILHLSDLHLDSGRSVEEVLQPLDMDLHDELGIDALDYLVITGDLAHKCSETGFQRAQEFIEALIRSFNLNSSRLIIAPGNHDLDRECTVYELELDAKRAQRAPEEKRVQKDDIFLLRNESEYPKRFNRFRACYKALTQSDYPLEHSEQGVIIPFPEDGLEFLTLNSAWEIDRFHVSRVSINGAALSKALMQSRSDAKLRIVVWHHAVYGTRPVANPEVLERLIAKGYRLCLHGDVHEERNDSLNQVDPNRMLFVVGTGSFSSAAAGLPSATPRLYNIIEVERDFRKVRIRARAQRRLDGAFAPHAVYGAGSDPDLRRGDYWFSIQP